MYPKASPGRSYKQESHERGKSTGLTSKGKIKFDTHVLKPGRTLRGEGPSWANLYLYHIQNQDSLK